MWDTILEKKCESIFFLSWKEIELYLISLDSLSLEDFILVISGYLL